MTLVGRLLCLLGRHDRQIYELRARTTKPVRYRACSRCGVPM